MKKWNVEVSGYWRASAEVYADTREEAEEVARGMERSPIGEWRPDRVDISDVDAWEAPSSNETE